MEKIFSLSNNRLKEIRALSKRKYRQKNGLFVVEGQRMVEDAIEFGQVRVIVMSDSYTSAHSDMLQFETSEIQLLEVPEKLFAALTDTETPQGILAVVKKKQTEVILNSGNVVIADGIQDPGNMGTLIRTAVASGCCAVMTTEGTVDVYNPKVLRSTMGAIFNIPVIDSWTFAQIMTRLKEQGIKVLVADVGAEEAYYDVDLTELFALVVGNENQGPREETIAVADKLINIPMIGKIDSLNAAVAGSIVLYEALRQRNKERNKEGQA